MVASLVSLQKSLGVSARDISEPLLRADPHRWGSGLIHLIDVENDKTYCGKPPRTCPGTKFQGGRDQITCKACLRVIDARARAEEIRRTWAAEERARQEDQRLWWQRYDAYLKSATWYRKRERVFERARGYCEGCRNQPAEQVHHRVYPRDCQPGSPEWIAKEKLFDLVALCDDCHRDVHG